MVRLNRSLNRPASMRKNSQAPIILPVIALLAISVTARGDDFVRSDANADGSLDLTDGIATLFYLFSDGTAPECRDASDTDDSGSIDLSDAIFTINFLFAGGPPPGKPFATCGADPTTDALDCATFPPCATERDASNILLVIADDFGVDAAACYAHENTAPMTTLNSLCSSGVVFRNAWSAPVCAPTRATILTGRYGFRTGVDGLGGGGLSLDELTLPAVLDAADSGYAQACIGKWHLGTNRNGGADHPNLAGFSHFSGSLGGGVGDYHAWDKTVNGETARREVYATTDTVNDALAWVEAQDSPWFLWLAFNAPHTPLHLPPAELQDYDLDGSDIGARPREYYNAAVEAMDRELGRLLSSLSPGVRENTNVIFVGDNGTAGRAVLPPLTRARAKDSLYEGGIHVPLVISGPAVALGGRDSDTLVNTTDLFATILDLAGVDVAAALSEVRHDSLSLLPVLEDPAQSREREFCIAELFGNMAADERRGRTIRDDRYKLIRFEDGRREAYDLVDDPNESQNLLNAPLTGLLQLRIDALDLALDELLASD